MIRGYFAVRGTRRRPVVDAVFQFPRISPRSFQARLLVDIGADRTAIAPLDAMRLQRELGMDLTTLPKGQPGTGVGGQMETRTLEAVLTLDSFSTPLTLTILEPPPGLMLPIPSLLGRDILLHFALFLEERTNRVLLLEPGETNALPLP